MILSYSFVKGSEHRHYILKLDTKPIWRRLRLVTARNSKSKRGYRKTPSRQGFSEKRMACASWANAKDQPLLLGSHDALWAARLIHMPRVQSRS